MPIKRTAQGGFEVHVCVRGQRLHRRLPPGESAANAKKLESELRLALERATPKRSAVVPGDPSMRDIMILYFEEAQHLRSPVTAQHHAARINTTTDKFRATEARACAAEVVKDLRARKFAVGTINRSLGTMKRGLRLAWERGLTRDDMSQHITLLPENNARETYLSVDQVRELADAASENVRAVVWVALLTGCRRKEVLSITKADVAADSVLIRSANTKTLKTRTVPIFPALRPWLAMLPVPITYEGVKTGFRRAREKVGRPDVQFRDLRRSCGMLLLSLDVPLDVIRDVLGHASIKTTEKHYAHAIVTRQRAALEKLGALTEKTGTES
jgi:integrase